MKNVDLVISPQSLVLCPLQTTNDQWQFYDMSIFSFFFFKKGMRIKL